MDIYTFRLERIHISRTRSPHTDTNYLTLSLNNGKNPLLQINAKLGDMPDGDYSVSDLISRTPQPSLGIGPSNAANFVEIINPQDPVIISWAIVNRGHANDQQAINEINQIGNNLINKFLGSGSGTGNTDPMPAGMHNTDMGSAGWGSEVDWAAIAKWVFGWLINLLDPNCDGGVVAQTITTTAAELATKTQGGVTFRKTLSYPGTDSAVGCGANSLYFVEYSITYKHIPDHPGRGAI
jgi:hypothetical protein